MHAGSTRFELLLTTHLGLEDVVEQELREACGRANLRVESVEHRPGGFAGRLLARLDGEPSRSIETASTLRCIHHVLRPLARWSLPDLSLKALRVRLAELDVPELSKESSFRVRCRRKGIHSFASQDVERVAGAVLQARYGTAVDLTSWKVCVRLEVRQERVEASVQYTRRPLSLRHRYVYRPRTSLKASVAHAMLRLSGGLQQPPARVLDPFCGSGTLLMEAGDVWPATRLFGSDVSSRAAEGASANLNEAGMRNRSVIRALDVRQAASAWRRFGPFDRIVTNPPFGARLGRGIDFRRFYPAVCAQLAPLLVPGGTLALLTLRPTLLIDEAPRHGLLLRHRRRVELEPLTPTLLVFERRPSEAVQ